MGMQAGQERSSRGTAAGGVVELRESQPLLRQAVEIGGLDLSAIAADVRIAHVIVEYQQYVG